MKTHDIEQGNGMNINDIELPPNPITPMLANLIDKASGAGTAETVWQIMQEFANQAIEADRKLHDRMLAHEWIRLSLGLDEDAPYRFDFYAQEIEKLKAELKKFGRNDNDNRKRMVFAGYQYQGRDGAWNNFMDLRHYENTVADGTWPIRAIYTATEQDKAAEPSRSEPGVSTTQALITLGKVIAGYRPGEEGWSEYDQQAYDIAMSIPQPLSESDIPTDPTAKESLSVAEPVKEIELRAEDLHVSTYSPTSSPQWAAHNDRGVRIVHLPTGTVAESHEELSSHRNREIALDRLRQAVAAEPVKVDAEVSVLSDEEILEVWYMSPAGPIEYEVIEFARALLAKYGNTQQEN